MNSHGRGIVLDLEFETALGETCRALCDEGLVVIGRIDIRDHFWRGLSRDFRPYVLLEAWSADSAFEALQHDLEIGTVLPTRFAIYQLAPNKTAVAVSEPLSSTAAAPEWRRDAPPLAAIADRESERVERVLARLRHTGSHQGSTAPVV